MLVVSCRNYLLLLSVNNRNISIQAVQYILVGEALQEFFLAFLLATRKANQLAN
ncbi:MAG: hypothetical protein AVDCRST_MAG95-1827 [uncultured Adhaeribacter sp.]|uniref:Uncharacterized protein n=1 Tax=uncultured Adhaeribacter sp. TaxID=448109 RepID=A0A6J4IGT0_9BACT|nr:MAG: hypothetical protein AVDCRST_MAG95-1827 [uncultured Adhaeribacter sp.]